MFKFITLALAAFGLSQSKNCEWQCNNLAGELNGFSGSFPPFGVRTQLFPAINTGLNYPGINVNQINKLTNPIVNNPLNNQGNIVFTGKPIVFGGNIAQSQTQYVIRNSYGNVLDISQTKPTDAIIYGFHGGPNQRFTITNDGVNSVIRCVQDNGVVESNYQGKVTTGGFNNSPNEKWRINKVVNAQNPNLFMIINAADGNCLDLKESRNENENDVINYPCHGLPNQLWQIIPIVPGTTVLPTSYSSYCA